MKKTKIFYWVVTVLFAGFMIATAVPDIMRSPDAAKFITSLGYPIYFVRFIGIAKVLGGIAILIPGFPRIKEWAYAGLFFDLFGAFYSAVAQNGFDPMMLMMFIFIGALFLSYGLYHKVYGGVNSR